MTDSLRYFAQCLFAGHIAEAVDEFTRFLTPSSGSDLGAARRDLIEALKSYVESERVGPGGFNSSDAIFEIEMLAIVRKHAHVTGARRCPLFEGGAHRRSHGQGARPGVRSAPPTRIASSDG